ncbi:hypothetical protein JHK86_007836 [Glycine max]|nr:hypothetical protein JHK86_007836 [Glycine max]
MVSQSETWRSWNRRTILSLSCDTCGLKARPSVHGALLASQQLWTLKTLIGSACC